MKKKMMRRAITFSLASLMAVSSALPLNDNAALWSTELTASAASTSGKCGPDLTWALSGEGVLTIIGTGNMNNYASFAKPWEKYAKDVKQVIIADGVTTIGANAFTDCVNMTAVTIPDSVEKIDTGAFQGCAELLYVNMTPTDRVIVSTAFDGTAYAETYCTTEKSPTMNYGSAREMRGKQVVVNIFLDELTGELPNLETQKDEWEEVPAEIKKDFDNYDLENYYYDFFYDHVYKIPKEKITYTLSSGWAQGFKETTKNNAVAVSLDSANFVDYYKSSKNTFPEGDEFKGKYVYSDMMRQRLNLVESTLNQLEDDAAKYNVTDLEFVSDTSLNYYFTYNRWNDDLETITFQSSDNIYENQIIGKRASITPTKDKVNDFNFCGTAKKDSNVMEQIKIASNGEIDLLRAETDEMSPFAQKLMEQYDADGVVVLFHMYAPFGVSYTKNTRNGKGSYSQTGEEFTVIYENSVPTAKHEVCHLYGAEDHYANGLKDSNMNASVYNNDATFKMYCDTYFRNCPDMMYDDSNAYSVLTAYTLGWYDMVEKDLLPLFADDKRYYPGDIDMDGKITVADRKLLSGYISGDQYLTPVQRMLAGEGLSPEQNIEGWTDKIKIQQMDNMQQYIQFIGVNPDTYMYTIENDMNFDAVYNSEDSALYEEFITGKRTPNYFQAMAMQYVTNVKKPVKYSTVLSEWEDRIAAEMKKYPDGDYWNKMDESGSVDGATKVPCDHSTNKKEFCNAIDHKHSMSSTGGKRSWHTRYDCSYSPLYDTCTKGKWSQCCGFARKVAEDIWGTDSFVRYYIEDGKITRTADSEPELYVPQVGDQIRLYSDGSELASDPNAPAAGHSLFITGIDGDVISFAECNGDMNSCEIRWSTKVYKYKVLANNEVVTDGEVTLTTEFLRENAIFVERPVLRGDFNLNGKIDSDDSVFFNSTFLLTGSAPSTYFDTEFDVNGDLKIDNNDKNALTSYANSSVTDGYILRTDETIQYTFRTSLPKDAFVFENGIYIPISETDKTAAFYGLFDRELTSFSIPESVTNPANKTTYKVTQLGTECRGAAKTRLGNLKHLEIPATIEIIHGYSLGMENQLTRVTFAEGSKLKSIESAAFSDSTKLANIILPSSVENIGNGAFSNCTNLRVFKIAADASGNCNLRTAGDNIFIDCPNMASPILPYTPNLTTPGSFKPSANGSADSDVAGDLNGDDALSVVDAILLQRWIMSDDVEIADRKNADFCRDGKINAFDLAILKKLLLDK